MPWKPVFRSPVVGRCTHLDGPGETEERLVRTAAALAQGVLRPEVLQLRRLAISETARFPDEVATYFERGPGSSLVLLARAFRVLDEQGQLVVPDPDLGAAVYAYAAVGPLQDRALLTGSTPTPAEIDRYATGAARAFYAAHHPD